MTKNEMEQLRRIPDEIEAIKKSLNNPRMEFINVYWKDYRTGKGIPKSRTEYDYDHQQQKRLKNKLKRKIKTLNALMIKAEEFIEGIEDSETRTILRSYYINGDKQKDIAEALHYTPAAISIKIDRFWKNRI